MKIPEWWNGLDQDFFNEYLADPDDEIDELVKNHLAEKGGE